MTIEPLLALAWAFWDPTWQPTWTTVIRVTGIIAWDLLVVDATIGVMAAGGVARSTMSPRGKYRWHTIIGWALMVMILVHVLTIVLSSYQGWGWNMVTEVGFGTVGRNAGVVAAYLLIVVFLAAILKKWLPKRLGVAFHHFAPFFVILFATIHGLLAGSDASTPQIILPGVVCLTILGTVFVVRGSVTHTRLVKASKGKSWRQRRDKAQRGPGLHWKD